MDENGRILLIDRSAHSAEESAVGLTAQHNTG